MSVIRDLLLRRLSDCWVLALSVGFVLLVLGFHRRASPIDSAPSIHYTVDCTNRPVEVAVEFRDFSGRQRFRFGNVEERLGIGELRFLTTQGLSIPFRTIHEKKGNEYYVWHEITVVPRVFRAAFTITPTPHHDIWGNASQIGWQSQTATVMRGEQFLLIPGGTEFAPVTCNILGEGVVGCPKRWAMGDLEDLVYSFDLVFAAGVRELSRSDEWVLHVPQDADQGYCDQLVRGFHVLVNEVRRCLPDLLKQELNVIIVTRSSDKVKVIGCSDPRVVCLDTDQAHPRLWVQVMREYARTNYRNDWFGLGLVEVLGDQVTREASQGRISSLENLRIEYETDRGMPDSDLRRPIGLHVDSSLIQDQRMVKGGVLVAFLHQALLRSGVQGGIWEVARIWYKDGMALDALSAVGGIRFARRVRQLLAENCFPIGSYPSLEVNRRLSEKRIPIGKVSLAIAGEGMGQLETCGCNVKSAGGLARRARILAGIRSHGIHPLTIDLGNSLTAKQPRQLDHADADEQRLYVELLELMGTDVCVVGTSEVLRGNAFLESTIGASKINYVGCNVRIWPETKRPRRILPWTIMERGGVRIGIVGFSEMHAREAQYLDFGDVPDPLVLEPGMDALFEAIAEIKVERPQLVIVAGWMRPDTMHAILQTFPKDIDVLLNSNTSPRRGASLPQRAMAGGFVGGTAIVFHALGDQAVTLLNLHYDGTGVTDFDFEMTVLDNAVLGDPKVEERLREYYKSAAERELQSLRSVVPLMQGDPAFKGRYVGSERCASCHASEHTQYQGTKHAMAFGTLVRVGRSTTIRCTPCHVIAYGSEEGWNPRDPQSLLRNVGCESCHGAGEEHVRTPQKDNIRRIPLRATCEACHDEKHSPTFGPEFESRWGRIKH